jgi:hypothetical protein
MVYEDSLHDWQTCERPEDCEECTALVENDVLMACDGDDCGSVGLKEINAEANVLTDWHLMDCGAVLCGKCFDEIEREERAMTCVRSA